VNIDNNRIEGTFRPTKIGLRNYLFIGHPAAGWRSAVVYSVVATCKLLGVNPENYIAWVLPKLAAATNKTAIGLLPHDYARLDQIDDLVLFEDAEQQALRGVELFAFGTVHAADQITQFQASVGARRAQSANLFAFVGGCLRRNLNAPRTSKAGARVFLRSLEGLVR
jgi:IS66 C-terminal element